MARYLSPAWLAELQAAASGANAELAGRPDVVVQHEISGPGGDVIFHYRTVREVAAVDDTFIGEDRRGVLLRQPRLGPVLEVSGCLAACEQAASWKRIYPEDDGETGPQRVPTRGPGIAVEDAAPPRSAGDPLSPFMPPP